MKNAKTLFLIPCIAIGQVLAGTSFLNNNAVLSQATRAAVSANGDSHAIATADPNAASAVLDWTKFNVGSGQTMTFDGSKTTFFNLVDGAAGKSQIDGIINGTAGNVWVINPAGVAFSSTARIDIGGLFAAAAGNISNADALRSGSALLPEFSSFGGLVSSDAGATFSADQVAFLGKSVEVSGDFYGDVAVGAGGKMIVEEVGGGVISVIPEDFANDVMSDVELGDLVSLGSIAVHANGNVAISGQAKVMGDVEVWSANGDVKVEEGAAIGSFGDGTRVKLAASRGGYGFDSDWQLVLSDGSVMIDGMVFSDGVGGLVELYSARGEYSTGDVVVNGSVMGDTVLIGAGSTFAYSDVYGDYVSDTTHGSGDVRIAGNVFGVDNIKVVTSSGDVAIEKGGQVRTTGDVSELDISASGGLTIAGAVIADNAGNVEISSAQGWGAEDDINVTSDGIVVAGGNVTFYSGLDAVIYSDEALLEEFGGVFGYGGKVVVDGLIESGVDLSLYSVQGVQGSGMLSSGLGTLVIDGGMGDVKFIGQVSAKNAVVRGTTYFDYGFAGDVYLLNKDNAFGRISANGKNVAIQGHGDVNVGNVVAEDGKVRLYWSEGNVHIGENSIVEAKGESAVVNIGIGLEEPRGEGDIVVDGSVRVSGGHGVLHLSAKNGDVVVNGKSEAAGDVFMVAGGDGRVEVRDGALVSSRDGKVSASSIAGGIYVGGEIDGETSVSLMTNSGDIEIDKNAVLSAKGASGSVSVYAAIEEKGRGDAVVKGTLIADGENGKVSVSAAGHNGDGGNVVIDGTLRGASKVSLHSATGLSATHGGVTVNGTVTAGDEFHAITGDGDVVVGRTGTVSVTRDAGQAVVGTGIYDGQHGDIIVKGSISAAGEVYLSAGSKGESATGGIFLGGSGSVSAGSGAYLVTHGGNLVQDGSYVDPSKGGYVSAVSLRSAVNAPTVNLKIDGSVGNGDYGFVAVDGKVFGSASGDASIAAANGKPFVGGEHVGLKEVYLGSSDMGEVENVDFGSITLDWGNMDGDSTLVSGGKLSIYTASNIEPYGNLLSGRDMTVSARSFGDVSYLRAGGTLTINNVGHPKYPRVAYFESLDGKEPRINNLPNDTVIFVDGRLAGGNINIMNMFGANEAFLVSTPELKSTQGIFGNPPFLHSDLDVANPMEVSAIDYLIQEVPRLTLSSEFPADVDQKVEANGLSLKDSYWFGQERVAKKPSEPTDGKVASAEE